MDLSHRANNLLSVLDKKEHGCDWSNPWSPENPTGTANMCTALNGLCNDMINERFSLENTHWKVPVADITTYRAEGGFMKTRECLARFVEESFKSDTTIDPKEIIVTEACASAFDFIAFAIGNPGDVFLTPSPHYAYIYYNCVEKSQVVTIPVPTDTNENNKFRLSIDNFENVYNKVTTDEGKTIRGIVLINPQNPLGICYSEDELMAILAFAKSKNLFVIFDEIYGTSVHDPQAKFVSCHSIRSKLSDPDKIIWMWSFSKDMCLPGLRFGMVHSSNNKLLECFTALERIHSVSQFSEYFVVQILSDREWLKSFNSIKLSRLRQSRERITGFLDRLGIPYIKPQGGLYVFANFRKFLADQTFEAEKELFQKIKKAGVYLNSGIHMNCSEPGWFRIVFSRPSGEVDEGLRRLEFLLDGKKL